MVKIAGKKHPYIFERARTHMLAVAPVRCYPTVTIALGPTNGAPDDLK